MHIQIWILTFLFALVHFSPVQAMRGKPKVGETIESLSTKGLSKKVYNLQNPDTFTISIPINPTQKKFQCDLNAFNTKIKQVQNQILQSKDDFIRAFYNRRHLPNIDANLIEELTQIQAGSPFLFSKESYDIMVKALPPKSLVYGELFNKNRAVIKNQLAMFEKELNRIMQFSEQGKLDPRFLPSGTNLIEILWKKNQLKFHFQHLAELNPMVSFMNRYQIYSHERIYMEVILQATEAYTKEYKFLIANKLFHKLINHCQTRESNARVTSAPTTTRTQSVQPIKAETAFVRTTSANSNAPKTTSAKIISTPKTISAKSISTRKTTSAKITSAPKTTSAKSISASRTPFTQHSSTREQSIRTRASLKGIAHSVERKYQSSYRLKR